MPSADFCPAIGPPHDAPSRRSDTAQISWGKLSRLPRTVAESTLRTLMDMDFAVRCPLVRCSRLVFGFCPSTRAFAWCFLQTSPRGDSPCTLLALHLHQVGQRTFTSKLLSMPSTQRNRSRGRALRAGSYLGKLRQFGPLEDRGSHRCATMRSRCTKRSAPSHQDKHSRTGARS